ncbi:hypothetical protein [Priestia koreensis]
MSERKATRVQRPGEDEGSCLGMLFRVFLLVTLFFINLPIGFGALWELLTIFGDGTFVAFLGKACLFWVIIYVAGFIVEQGNVEEPDSTDVRADAGLLDSYLIDFLFALPSFTYATVNRIFRFVFRKKK